MSAMASQITSLTIVYSSIYSAADQRKHQSSVSLAFVRGIHRSPVNSPHKGPVTRKMFPFDDVIISLVTCVANHHVSRIWKVSFIDIHHGNTLLWFVNKDLLYIYFVHNDVSRWKYFPRYWPFVRGIHRSPVDSRDKGQGRGALMFLWSVPEQTVEQTAETPAIWDTIAPIMTSL